MLYSMLPTVTAAKDGARALLLLTLAAPSHSGVEDPCKYTPDGFERPRSPCGVNGNCSVSNTWSDIVPKQKMFSCICLGNYVGDRCERCAHGFAYRSGCEEMVRQSEGTGFVLWASILGGTAVIAAIVMLVITLAQRQDPGILFSRMSEAGKDQIVLMRSTSSLVSQRAPKKRDVCYYCKQSGHWKINCPVYQEHLAASGGEMNAFATAADYHASRKGRLLEP